MFHLMSELLTLSSLYALKEHEGLLSGFERSQSSAVLSDDPVKAHLPSGVRLIEYIAPVCSERTRGLLSGFERSQSRAV